VQSLSGGALLPIQQGLQARGHGQEAGGAEQHQGQVQSEDAGGSLETPRGAAGGDGDEPHQMTPHFHQPFSIV